MIKKPPLILLVAFLFSLILHLTLLQQWLHHKYPSPPKTEDVVLIQLHKDEPQPSSEKNQPRSLNHPQGAYLDAPPPPSAEDWAFATKYSLKNSKAYRYMWGQQVRSMMGTAYEGADQGQVRFSIEIAPNGSITRVETIWKTSDVAEALARKAIFAMPSLPPTPTGKSLIFARTISFTPYASDGPPIYKDDCLPDAPPSSNLFTWDGKSEPRVPKNSPITQIDPKALADCMKQLPQDSIEAEDAHNQRQLKTWRSNKLN